MKDLSQKDGNRMTFLIRLLDIHDKQKKILCFLLSAKHETFLKYLLDFHNVK